jgi:uncharacterized protein YceH (UPF0502 family)
LWVMNDKTDEEKTPESEAMLTALEARVLGALMEKQLATPEHYPLTLSSLVAACNQKSNRDPVLQLSTGVVEEALKGLRQQKKWAVMVHEAGARVPKFRQEFTDAHGLNSLEQAVVTELLLRGPQTVAELRARVPRMVPTLADGAVETALENLENLRGMCFVKKLPRAHGRRESRYAHQLCGEVSVEAEETAVVIEAPKSLELARVEALEEDVARLKSDLNHLREAFEAFREAFQ